VDGGKQLAVGTLDGRVLLVDPAAAATVPPTVLVGPGPGITGLAVNAQGSQLAIAAANGTVSLKALAAGGATRTLANPRGTAILSMAFLPDGRLAGAAKSGGALVWTPDRPGDAPRAVFGDRAVRAVAATNGRIAAGTEEGPILLLSAGLTGTPVQLTGHSSAVTGLRFSPDGTRLASSSLDGTIRLWDVNHQEREPIVLTGHTGWVWGVDFASRGQRLVSGGADRTVRSWPTAIEPLASSICQHAKGRITEQEWHEFTPGDIPLEPACAATAPAPRSRAGR
jgi:WD40 repeat protein